MDRALNRSDLEEALGNLPATPSAETLQGLLADAELALFSAAGEISDELVRAGWYLHAVGSQAGDQVEWSRRERAFRVSAHILELASRTASGRRRLELIFGSQLGYRRGGLDPNAAALFGQARGLLDDLDEGSAPWRETLAIEAAIFLLGFRTQDAFAWIRARRAGFARLRREAQLDDLAGTLFGPAEQIVEACNEILRFLIFGDSAAYVEACRRLERLLQGDGDPATIDELWVAAHLLSVAQDFETASVWTCLPADVPAAARRALTATSPPVLTLWPPQRALLGGPGARADLLSPTTRRAVLSVPTSAGKTLVAQILVLNELARNDLSVCLVAPQRSLVREIRRSLLPRVRALRKNLSPDLPDFLSSFATELLLGDPPDVDVMTPERFAALLRADPDDVLNRYGLFVFDEAHLVGDVGRGFTLEGALTYLHWKTRETDHRIILMSAAIGNESTFREWLGDGGAAEVVRSEWRGPRRLSAAYSTEVDWGAEQLVAPIGRERLYRLVYPLSGMISFSVPGAGIQSYVTTEPIGELVFRSSPTGVRGTKEDRRSSRHYEHVAALCAIVEHAGPVLTVTGTRPDAQRLATALAESRDVERGLRRTRDAIAAMLDPQHVLVRVIDRGVAFHHAGLPLEVLAILEDELRAGRLPHLVSTTTLTEGVNLPVHTVVLAETRWEDSEVHLSGPRMLNALGRAGRAGIETEGWVIFAPSGEAPNDPALHLPNPEDLAITSTLAVEGSVAALVDFEDRRTTASDAVFSDLPETLDSFTSFVWYVLACEELLGSVVSVTELDDAVEALLGARQMDADALQRLKRYARDVRTTFRGTNASSRRAWARTGSSVRSARALDVLSQSLTRAARGRPNRGEPGTAIDLLSETGVLAAALQLPDVPDNAWEFRVSPRGDELQVDLGEALRQWIAGRSLAEMADGLLGAVPEPEWRIEQLVDRVSRGFGHAVSWMSAALLERTNQRLAELELEPICPNLPLYIKFGVDSPAALRLVTQGVRNRDVAVRVQRAAAEAGIAADVVEGWLSSLPITEWAQKFGARPADILDLLDVIRQGDADLLRRLLDGDDVEIDLGVSVPDGALSLELDESGDVPIVGVRASDPADWTALGNQWQGDLRTVLATGVAISVERREGESIALNARG